MENIETKEILVNIEQVDKEVLNWDSIIALVSYIGKGSKVKSRFIRVATYKDPVEQAKEYCSHHGFKFKNIIVGDTRITPYEDKGVKYIFVSEIVERQVGTVVKFEMKDVNGVQVATKIDTIDMLGGLAND